tara:strand:+ start:253 stop:1035 length:783 start_codon:yes stop_codon:yes gene_type:complete
MPVAFGIAAGEAIAVELVGTWKIPAIEDDETYDESELDSCETDLEESRLRERYAAIDKKNAFRAALRKKIEDYQWNEEQRRTIIPMQESRPGIYSRKALLPFGIYEYYYRITKPDGSYEQKADKKRIVAKTVLGEPFNRIHITNVTPVEAMLYKIVIEDGVPDIEEIDLQGENLSKSLLNDKYVYIVDCDTELFVWMGKSSSSKHRKIGMALARKMMSEDEREDWCPSTPIIVYSGAEMPTFTHKFPDWHSSLQVISPIL